MRPLGEKERLLEAMWTLEETRVRLVEPKRRFSRPIARLVDPRWGLVDYG